MIRLKDLTLRRGSKTVLEHTSLTLNPGEKVGLVGRNGAGKSSLFALLTGKLLADGGEMEMPPRWLTAEVAQDMPETSQDATTFVLEGDSVLAAAQSALAQAEHDNDGEAMAEAHLHIAEAGGFDARPRAQAMLLGLGFKMSELDAPVNSFSGGWRMRLQLARSLMSPADLLLLDEPTNHLDLDALVWLESWLQRFTGTLVIISHDREFLDALTQVTVHLENAQLTRYSGNYSAFEEQHAERLVLQQAAYAKQQVHIEHLQKFIDRFRYKATKAKQAQSRIKALERMERVAPVLTAASFTFEFKEPPALPNPMLVMDGVTCGYAKGHPVLTGIKCSVLAGQRIGILGANGQGKSTLVKTIAQQIPSLSGRYTQGKGLSIGYFAQQELDILRPQETALEHMVRLAETVTPNAREQELRNFLGGFHFVDEMARQPVGTMSGGEKARLVLAMLVWQRPNLLLLDEPTNHLDLVTREALAVALNTFEGTVMLVSHDRAMLRSVCDEFWLVAEGGLTHFDGDLSDYQRYLMEHARQQREALSAANKAGRSAEAGGAKASHSQHEMASTTAASPNDSTALSGMLSPREERRLAAKQREQVNALTRPLKKETTMLEARMAAIGTERAALEKQLSTPGIAPAEIAEAGKQLKALTDEQQQVEERWLTIAEEIHMLEADLPG